LAPLLLLAFLAAAPPSAGQDAKARGKRFALLVGVKDYDHSKFDPLKYTENDVDELARLLRADASGFAKVTLLTTSRGKDTPSARPTRKNILAVLKAILAGCKRHDTVLVALAGHGVQLKVKDKPEAFFCPADASPNDPGRLIGLKWLIEQLDESGAGVKLVLVDACRNDPKEARSLDVDSVPRPPRGTAVLFSCASGQRAFETSKLGKGHGVFFHYVLQGLQGEAKNKKGQVTWNRLVDYVTTEVPEVVPKLIGEGAQQSPHNLTNIVGASPVLLDGLASAAQAVTPKGTRRKPGLAAPTVGDSVPFLAESVATYYLLRRADVRKELKLTGRQIEQIDKARNELVPLVRIILNVQNIEDAKADRKKYRELTTPLLKELAPDQLKRLTQLRLQYAPFISLAEVFENREVRAALGLTETQKDRVRKIVKEFEKKSKSLRSGPGDKGERRSAREAADREALGKILRLFTDEQKRKWKELTGEPFEFK
jgi:hypothetical protein